jgi:hypothetical protein
VRCISALASQYARQSHGRAVPRELPIARPKSLVTWRRPEPLRIPDREDFDHETAIWSTSSGPPTFQSEPPSPPPTPKTRPVEDRRSVLAPLSEEGGPSHSGSRHASRPSNGVFRLFCPEAMALQVDITRPLPAGDQRCKCGYQWRRLDEKNDGALILKDGFRMTPRFLAKSHSDQAADDIEASGKKAGFGCVLCTSTGCVETYETAELLLAHINAVHTKWQMLHDRDMTWVGQPPNTSAASYG